MSKYAKEGEQDKVDGQIPDHPDCQRNVDYFRHVWNELAVWVGDPLTPEKNGHPTYEFQDRSYESVYDPREDKRENLAKYKFRCVILLWKENGVLCTTNLTLHQDNFEFKKQVCNCMNYFGSKGFLKHRDREDNGVPRSKKLEKKDLPVNNWDRLNQHLGV